MSEHDVMAVGRRLAEFRHKLLDTSLQNRLVNFRSKTKAGKPLEKVVEIHGESADKVLNILIRDAKAMKFVGRPDPRPQRAPTESLTEDAVETPEETVSTEGTDQDDLNLNTVDTVTALKSKLTKIWRDSRTILEEQGVNSLFLALGVLEWYEADSSEEVRRAPLLLLPVQLDRTQAGMFRIRHDGEDVVGNLSMAAKLRAEFGLKLPDVPEDPIPSQYFDEVSEVIRTQKRWSVNGDVICLGFFSYAKYLMYRDLDPAGWPDDRLPEGHPVLGALLDGGFGEESDSGFSEAEFLDEIRGAAESCEVYDADSSQMLAILQANAGRSMVIEGPPGTGKSQTITNLIAEAVGNGKRVLFVAEKAAALDVVFRRLKEACLEDACLELHSNKANKRSFYAELKRTVELAAPRAARAEKDLEQLEEARGKLNEYAYAVHTQIGTKGITPRLAMGKLLALGKEPSPEGRHTYTSMTDWDEDGFQTKLGLVRKLQAHVAAMGQPGRHPYFGCTLEHFLPADKEDLARLLATASVETERFHASANSLAEALRVELPILPEDVERLREWAHYVSDAPDLEGIEIGQTDWSAEEATLRQALANGTRFAAILHRLNGETGANAIDQDLQNLVEILSLAPLGARLSSENAAPLRAMDAASAAAFTVVDEAEELARTLGLPRPSVFSEIETIASVAKRTSTAPDVQGMAVADPTWLDSEDKINAALAATRKVQDAKSRYGSVLTEAAWTTDVREDLQALEQHGQGLLRFFNASFKSVMARTSGLFRNPSKNPQDRIAAFKAILVAEEAGRELTTLRGSCSALIGEAWGGERSDLGRLAEAVSWIVEAHRAVASGRLPLSVLQYLERGGSSSSLGRSADTLRQSLTQAQQALATMRKELERLGTDVTEDQLYAYLLGSVRPCLSPLKSVVLSPEAKGFAVCLEELELIQEAQQLRTSLLQEATAAAAFGHQWRQENSDWDRLSRILDWALDLDKSIASGSRPPGLRTFFVEQRPRSGLDEAVRQARSDREGARTAVKAVLDHVRLDGDPAQFTESPIQNQRDRIALWTARIEDINSLIRYNALAQEARAQGLGESVDLAERWPDAPTRLAEAFERTWYTGLVREAVQTRPAIAHFDRSNHEAIIAQFRTLDRTVQAHNRVKVALTHWRTVPRGSAGGAMGFLLTQFNLRQNHRPIRIAMEKAGEAVQAIKRVFLMSPLSVAMYLPANGPRFDLVIFDEASQVKPEDALGALVRGSQTVVVGDSKQMPPTSFFDKLTNEEPFDEDEEVDDDGSAMKELESVLAMMSSKIPEQSPQRRWLRWHYRSEHDALIATSNRLSYENRLVIFPSPWRSGAHTGLIFRYEPSTVYGRGTTRKNILEARAVAQAVQKHIQEHPKLTLGVAAFSKPQQEAILDEIEILRRDDLSFDAFDAAHPFEKLFVKNLENVQGDERDVILISIGYGKDENGFVSQSFGPINRDGGERRLNVLITRARKRCEVFSNIRAADIREDFGTKRGVRDLRAFLAFADTGSLDVATNKGAEAPSPFEEVVLDRLRQDGYDVEPQVGSSGFFVDLAVRHPEQPERFVLAIECDGAKYNSARSSRDRDKLRHTVLEARGWRIHRIWSTDWFHNSESEYERLKSAIAHAIAGADEEREEEELSARPSTFSELERDAEATTGDETPAPYQYTELTIQLGGLQLHEVSPSQLADWIMTVVETEAPVHIDEVVRRIREGAGIARAGARIQAAVEAGVQLAVHQQRLVLREGFLHRPGDTPVTLRSRAGLGAMKKLEHVSPEEVQLALKVVVGRSFGIEPNEAIGLAARTLGFERTTVAMVERFKTELAKAVQSGEIEASGSLLRLPAAESATKGS